MNPEWTPMRRPRMEMEVALDAPTRLRAVPRRDEGPLPRDATDGELLVRVGRRDGEAFEVLYRRYVRPVFGLALRRLSDRQRAEDAVQETFAAAWRSAASYRPERGPAAPWLYAVARNAVIDKLRARAEPPSEAPDLVSAEPGPPNRAEAAFVAWRVHRALEELPDRERDVIELAYWSDMSQSEVAEYLHIPLGTVKTRTRSALARLAAILDGELT
jgi:RNA polymerase sigma-70 factor (ECF subfamily)